MIFQSTPSVWRETEGGSREKLPSMLFQSTPSVWRETLYGIFASLSDTFQSTPSVWRETRCCQRQFFRIIYFNPLPPYGGRLSCRPWCRPSVYFNPLPPYGGRHGYCKFAVGAKSISIHSLRMEGDNICRVSEPFHGIFQSTPSVWRETLNQGKDNADQHHFNPLPPYGGRPQTPHPLPQLLHISIHSLRMEGDSPQRTSTSGFVHFNPLPPYGGRPITPPTVPTIVHFNPLPPYGGRQRCNP